MLERTYDMDEIVFCPKCAWIGYSYQINKNRGDYMICCECHSHLIGTGIPTYDDPPLQHHEWFELRRKIYREMIEPLGQLDKSLPSFKEKYYEYIGGYEEDLKDHSKTIKFNPNANKSNVVRCPACGSTKVQKISTGNKIGSAMIFGIFSLGHLGKTFKCLSCGYKF